MDERDANNEPFAGAIYRFYDGQERTVEWVRGGMLGWAEEPRAVFSARWAAWSGKVVGVATKNGRVMLGERRDDLGTTFAVEKIESDVAWLRHVAGDAPNSKYGHVDGLYPFSAQYFATWPRANVGAPTPTSEPTFSAA